jgi:hypothetical protein
LRQAKTIGTGLDIGPNVFAGIRGINVGDGREKLVRTLNNCPLANESKVSRFPSTVEQNAENANTENEQQVADKDEAVAKRVARNFNREFKRGGMFRLKESVTQCYQQASRSYDYSSIEYCYILDQISCGMDAAFWKNLGKSQQDKFWLQDNAVKRTLALLNVPGIKSTNSLPYWSKVESLALKELLALQ